MRPGKEIVCPAALSRELPPRVWMNVNFHTENDRFLPPIRRHDHRIAVHPESRNEVLRSYHQAQSSDESKREAARLTKELSDFWLVKADSRQRDYRFLAASGAAREVLRIDPNSVEAKRRLDEAIATQTRIDVDLADAMVLIEKRQFPPAIETLLRILKLKPDHAVAHGKLGAIYATQRNREKAIEHLNRVAECDPNDAHGHFTLATMFILGNALQEALEQLRRAERAEPYSENVNYHLGLVMLRLEKPDEAAVHFRKALAIAPQHAAAVQGLGQALLRQGNAEEGLRHALRAARLTRGENGDAMLSLADAYAAVGRREDAIAAAQRALERTSEPQLATLIRRRLSELRTVGK